MQYMKRRYLKRDNMSRLRNEAEFLMKERQLNEDLLHVGNAGLNLGESRTNSQFRVDQNNRVESISLEDSQ